MLPLSVHLTAPVLHGVVQAVKGFVAIFVKMDVIKLVTGIADIVPICEVLLNNYDIVVGMIFK